MSETKKYYDLLGVDQTTSKAEVKKAYRKKALKLHPDHSKSSDTKLFLELTTAFEYVFSRAGSSFALPATDFSLIEDDEITDTAVDNIFNDKMYAEYTYFKPENESIERYERMSRANGCNVCHGMGTVSKQIDPSKGYDGIEERYCVCQRI